MTLRVENRCGIISHSTYLVFKKIKDSYLHLQEYTAHEIVNSLLTIEREGTCEVLTLIIHMNSNTPQEKTIIRAKIVSSFSDYIFERWIFDYDPYRSLGLTERKNLKVYALFYNEFNRNVRRNFYTFKLILVSTND